MKKIAIDISPIVYGTGVSVYTKELVKNILKIDKENQYIIFGYSFRRKSELVSFYEEIKTENTQGKFFSFPPMLAHYIWNRIHVLDIQNLIGDVDVVHTSDWTEPPAKNAYKVTTVHDLTPLLYPEYTHPRIVTVHKEKLKWVKIETDIIIAPSTQSKADLEVLKFKNQIEVIPEAVGNEIQFMSKSESIKKLRKYDLPDKFALMVGTAQRKNIVKTYNALQKAQVITGIKSLVVVGEKPEDLEFKNAIFLGRVESKDLSALYSTAELFLYTSIYEGFGLPILEAFKCKCPVVASDIGSIAEVTNGSAVLVDPKNETNISKGIIKVIKNKKKYIELGLRREKEYDWRETAKRTIKLYNNSV